jgi:hypothetical protein
MIFSPMEAKNSSQGYAVNNKDYNAEPLTLMRALWIDY